MLGVLRQFRHRRFRRDLSAYVDDMLSERARRRLEAHLDSCEACRQELAELRATVEALGSLPMAEAPRSFTLAAAPIAEARPRPAARRLEFGLRLATATAAFALTVVLIGDFAGLPGGGHEEEEWVGGQLYSATQGTPAALEAAPAGTPEFYGITEAPGVSDVQREESATDETPAAPETTPVETPTAEQAPAPPEGTLGETPVADETPPAPAAAPVGTPEPIATPEEAPGETLVADETPPAPAAAPVEVPTGEQTPAPSEETPIETPVAPLPGVTEPRGEEPTVGAGVSEEEPADKATLEGAEVEDEAEANAAEAQAVGEEDGGGLSREEVVRWLEIGLGAGVSVLVILWALARFQRSMGNRP
jgi:hypothetical protein